MPLPLKSFYDIKRQEDKNRLDVVLYKSVPELFESCRFFCDKVLLKSRIVGVVLS